MNHYFRLLFVGSILFVLLGIFSDRSDNILVQTSDSEEIEHVEFQAGILPDHPQRLSSETSSAIPGEQAGDLFGIRRHQEVQFTKNIMQQFGMYSAIYLNNKPVIICITGHFLHLDAGTEVPPLT